jgi:hypothetical protein
MHFPANFYKYTEKVENILFNFKIREKVNEAQLNMK